MADQDDNRPNVIIIGAGILGLSTAFLLQRQGLQVLVLDRKGPAAEASFGNAGAFAFSQIIPLATPETISKAPKWLVDPLGPLSIPPRYALKLAPWMLRFWLAARPERVENSIHAQASLMDHSKHALLPFLKRTATGGMLRRDGNLQVYESRSEFDASLPYWDARKQYGIPYEHVHGSNALAEYQPGLDKRFVSATFTPEWYSISDPLEYALTIADIFRNRGGSIEVAEAQSLSAAQNEATVKCIDGRSFSAEHVVVCAGAWSHKLAGTMGDRVPLETERGYNTTLPTTTFDLKSQITFGGHGFVVTRLGSGIRVGGAVELGGLKTPPNYQRADALLAKAKSFLPELDIEDGTQWMGFRPSLPDSLPVIGASRKSDRVVYAFGHGHLGLTQSAGTAELVCEMISGAQTSIDLTPFRADRF
jgi:D-amino-acid dehydrogenase